MPVVAPGREIPRIRRITSNKYGTVAVKVTAQPIEPIPLKTPKNTIIQAAPSAIKMCGCTVPIVGEDNRVLFNTW
jgi:hypothetical protein